MTTPRRSQIFPTRRPRDAALLLALIAALAAGGVQAQSGITDLGTLNGGNGSYALRANADGSVVVGYAPDGAAGNAQRAFRWTQAGGMVSLGVLNGGTNSYAQDANADSSVVVGYAADGGAGNNNRAFRWTQAGGMASLGVLNGGNSSVAFGVNADGGVVVGYAADGAAGNASRAFRWTQAGGMVSLGVLNGGDHSVARGTNTDGSVVVGEATDGGAGFSIRAFRWTQAGGMVSLGTINGGTESYARRVNADGSVVVGYANDGAAGDADRAFRWTQASGMVSLGVLNGGSHSKAHDLSADGSVVVGVAGDGLAGDADRAFRWTQSGGMKTVEDWLRSTGVSVAVTTNAAYGVSSDGSIVVGRLSNNNAFIARAGSGLVTLADVQDSLSATASGGGMTLSAAGTVLNGAHSRPLARRVGAGQSTAWIAGDWGRDDHGSRSGQLGLAEFGLGRNFGAAQINVSLGRTWAKQAQTVGGESKTDGAYLLAEALIPVASDLWATLGGYGQRGGADLRRGYLNAGLADASTGRPSVNTWGLRARLDWEYAAALGGADFTPYADFAYSRAKMAAYTETGGGFPARFDARTDKSTELRLGANAVKPLANGMRFVGGLEAAHRFETTGARTVGQVIGLFAFDLAGSALKRDWLRGMVGVEGKLGEGVASLSVNATTKSNMPNAWLAANWQMAF